MFTVLSGIHKNAQQLTHQIHQTTMDRSAGLRSRDHGSRDIKVAWRAHSLKLTPVTLEPYLPVIPPLF